MLSQVTDTPISHVVIYVTRIELVVAFPQACSIRLTLSYDMRPLSMHRTTLQHA